MSGAFDMSEAKNMKQQPDWSEEDDQVEVSPLVVDAVGKALQAHFKSIAEMPLPDRFLVLLAELEASERKSEPKHGA